MARMLGRARYRPVDPRDDGLLLDKRVPHQQQRAREDRELSRELAEYADEALELAELSLSAAMETWPEG